MNPTTAVQDPHEPEENLISAAISGVESDTPQSGNARFGREGGTALNVAIIAPPWYSVPPIGYGGINQQCYLLARELDRLGHEATVYCREGSTYHGNTIELFPAEWDPLARGAVYDLRWMTYLLRVYDDIGSRDFDVIQDNSNRGVFAAANRQGMSCPPVVTTVHEPMYSEQVDFLQSVKTRVNLVAVSEAQRRRAPMLPFRSVIYEAADVDGVHSSSRREEYLVQIARISPEKGQHIAIDVARAVDRPLVLAGKIDWNALEYFQQFVRPHLGQGVEWIENVSGEDKVSLLARAYAFLFPIQWEEPFGGAMAEAMASGTPVLACPRGSAPEVVEHGVTGFLCAAVSEFVGALESVQTVDRIACAERARQRFHPALMARKYLEVFTQVL